MEQSFAIGAPELAGFSMLGATAGASLSTWLTPGAGTHVAAGCAAGAVVLPIICMLPQLVAAIGRWLPVAPQFAGVKFNRNHLAEGDNPA